VKRENHAPGRPATGPAAGKRHRTAPHGASTARRRARHWVPPLAAAVLLAVACGGDGTGPADVLPAELVGVWVAEPACLPQCGFTFESLANPADTLNVTAFVGIATEVTLGRTGTFQMRTRPGPDTASVAQVRAAPGILVVTDAGGAVDTLDYSLSGDWLAVRFRRPFSVFDFTGDGVADPARARGVFRRR
jgi:hypothetical protein